MTYPLWSLRIAFSKVRPLNATNVARIAVVTITFALFLYGDFVLFRRLFRATAQIEAQTPFFALAILRNILAMVFLVATIVLFSSGMTAAIGAFFTDLDLDVYHAAPRTKSSIVVARWFKTLAESATVVYIFLIPLFVAYARQYPVPRMFFPLVLVNLALLLAIPVTLGALAIVALVRWFPVRRVHQIVATLAIVVLTLAVVAFRVSRPERFFADVETSDVVEVLKQIELPSMERYPGTALADYMVNVECGGRAAAVPCPDSGGTAAALHIGLTFAIAAAIFFVVAQKTYFIAFVRARESMAPVALGASALTRSIDRLLVPLDAPTRALVAKEVRTLSRDVAQWSQLFLMAALLFLYLYNIRMLPLGGDVRAGLIAYANLGMAGFVIAAICLRFAYPSVSSEGHAFWMVQSAPVSYRRFLLVKVFVYAAPLTLLAFVLTAFANVLLDADRTIWAFTLAGASMLAVTLVSLGVGLGALAPNFNAENPLQVGLSLGGFGYMAAALAYIGALMLLMARPLMHYLLHFGFGVESSRVTALIAIVSAITLSIALVVFPLLAAEKRLESRRN
jgi:ABC-2 type transport system permease protein